MTATLVACRCAMCHSRFALAGDPERLPDPLHCPVCGRAELPVLLMEREAWEVWELWRTLDAHLERLPAELRAPLADWEMRGGEPGGERGLWRLACAECGRESWLPTNALHCPACRAEAGLRRAG
jgi:hypothetical protein